MHEGLALTPIQISAVCTANTKGNFQLGLCFACFVYQRALEHLLTLLLNKTIKLEGKLVNAGTKRIRKTKKETDVAHSLLSAAIQPLLPKVNKDIVLALQTLHVSAVQCVQDVCA